MFKGNPQVYTSTLEQLAQALRTCGQSPLVVTVDTDGKLLITPFAQDLLERVLGDVWTAGYEQAITCEGNYQCVLRNNQLVHVQAVRSKPDAPLMLLTPMYPMPLEMLKEDERQTLPPFDERRLYEIAEDGSATPWAPALAAQRPKNIVEVLMYAGPHVDCRMPISKQAPEYTEAARSLVNRLVYEDNQIVWWRAITAPPHYTQDMIT